ncbi:MAG: hypothetical protein AAFV53_16765 [Myxococcota bacterium]
MWLFGTLLWSGVGLSQEPVPLNFSRDTEGVTAALGELLPQLQRCINETERTGAHLLRLSFEVSAEGLPGPVQPMWAPNDPSLAVCLAEPFAGLRFSPGEHPLPVEIPISVQVEEEFRTEVLQPDGSRVATAK